MNRNKWQGFTLIESLLVLGIVSALFLLPLITQNRWKQRQETLYFFTSLERQLFITQQAAVLTGQGSKVSYSFNEPRVIRFNYGVNQTTMRNVTLVLPPDYQTVGQVTLTFRPKTGTVNRITQLQFKGPRDVIVSYQFFIGGGRFEKRIKK